MIYFSTTRKSLLVTSLLSLVFSSSAWTSSPVVTRMSTKLVKSETRLFNENTSKKRKLNDMLNTLEEPFRTTKPNEVEADLACNDDLVPMIECIAKAADMRKAEDIKAIRVSKLTTTTSFVVLCSGNSRPQNQAIAAAIRSEVAEEFGEEYSLKGDVPEGNADSGWILLDFGSVMVHVMTPRSRLFYDIEGKWKKGELLDLSNVLLPNLPLKSDSSTTSNAIDENDPFWS